jgi:hypothetical protein
MKHTSGKGLALVAGCLASTGALAILLQDAIRSNVWTLDHGLIPLIMAIQIYTAHQFTVALQQRRLAAVGFLLVAVVSTWGVLNTSISKQSMVASETVAVVADTNARRASTEKRLASSLETLDDYRRQLAAECGSGAGGRCKGKKETVQVWSDAVSGIQAELAAIGPAKPVNARADKMAELISVLTGRDQDAVKRVLVLVEPFTYTLIFELAALVCFGYAFGGRQAPANDNRPAYQDSAQTDFPPPPGARLPEVKAIEPETNVIRVWAERFEEKYGRKPSVKELQAAFPQESRTTVWRKSKAA